MQQELGVGQAPALGFFCTCCAASQAQSSTGPAAGQPQVTGVKLAHNLTMGSFREDEVSNEAIREKA